jgi:diguanylate cyclase (GGDEF)-like protein
MATTPRTPPEPDDAPPARRREGDRDGERRRASRSLWSACEALLSAHEPRALNRALDDLIRAFACEAVVLHALGPSGELQPWCARGGWSGRRGDLRACLTVPLLRGSERVGSLALRLPAGRTWTPAKLGLIRTAAGALGAALGARLELQRLRHQPGRDPVTGLPDARSFHARLKSELDRARRHGSPLGLVMVDLDHFGPLNARHGRDAGDRALMEAALVLRLALRDSDSLARLGSNRFGILLPEADVMPSRRCSERLRAAVEAHSFARVGRISASFGVAASPRSGVEPLELLEAAERALTIAKKSGRRRVATDEVHHVH